MIPNFDEVIRTTKTMHGGSEPTAEPNLTFRQVDKDAISWFI